ncbi:MAG: CoA pyrophosphatase, partial [Polyangiales bacterium]
AGPKGIEVTPFVFLTEVAVEPTCGPEALAAFWLPLETAGAGAFDDTYTYPGSAMSFPSWNFDGHVIWGLTMRILADVLSIGNKP